MTTIQLTDGTTTLNLFDTASYMVIDQSWQPATGRRRSDGLGGLPYSPVTETMALLIKGTTVADCLDKLHNLTVLIDQADRWRNGEDVAAVVFKYKPGGSGLTNPLQATVLGGPEMGDAVTVPARVEWIGNNDFELAPVVLSFKRLGVMLGDEESDASSSTANPGVMTATNTATDLPSPVKLTLTNYVSANSGGSFLVVSDDADKIAVASCGIESMETDADYLRASDASKLPLGGTNVLRYTPPGTDWVQSNEIDIQSLLLSDTRDILIFINARRNSAAMSALMKAEVILGGAGGYNPAITITTEPIQLIYNDWYLDTAINPQWYRVGLVSLPVDISVPTGVALTIWTKTSSTASTVDYDAVCLVDARNSNATFIPFNQTKGLPTEPTLTIDHSLLTHVDPQTTVNSPTGLSLARNGARMFLAQSAEVAAIWLSNGVSSSPTPLTYYWCAVDIATGAKLSNVLTAVRRPAFLVPQ